VREQIHNNGSVRGSWLKITVNWVSSCESEEKKFLGEWTGVVSKNGFAVLGTVTPYRLSKLTTKQATCNTLLMRR